LRVLCNFFLEHDMTPSKSLCIAIGVVFVFSGTAIAQAVSDSSRGAARATDAKPSHATKHKQKHKRVAKRSTRETLVKSDERIIDRCRDLRFAEKAACLHEKRGDQYASLWRAIAAGNLDLAIGGTSTTGAAGSVTLPGGTQPVSDTTLGR
jgi:hypothetical protein